MMFITLGSGCFVYVLAKGCWTKNNKERIWICSNLFLVCVIFIVSKLVKHSLVSNQSQYFLGPRQSCISQRSKWSEEPVCVTNSSRGGVVRAVRAAYERQEASESVAWCWHCGAQCYCVLLPCEPWFQNIIEQILKKRSQKFSPS